MPLVYEGRRAMRIYQFNIENIPNVASLMSTIKPDFWDYQGAFSQLSDIRNSAVNVGWLIGEREHDPKGWLLCHDYPNYSCLSIECLGFDDNGNFVAEHQLEPLLNKAEEYARDSGYRVLRYTISSTDMSCHGKPLGNYWEALRDLKSDTRAHFEYFVKYGFKPAGFLPNCYAKGYHGVMMVKELI